MRGGLLEGLRRLGNAPETPYGTSPALPCQRAREPACGERRAPGFATGGLTALRQDGHSAWPFAGDSVTSLPPHATR